MANLTWVTLSERHEHVHRLARTAHMVASLSAIIVVAVTAATLHRAAPAMATQQSDDDAQVRDVGRMQPAGGGRPMAVDETRSLGFVADPEAVRDSRLHVMDLVRLRRVASTPEPVKGAERDQFYGFSPESGLALDAPRARLYATGSYSNVLDEQTCSVDDSKVGLGNPTASGPRRGHPVFDYRPGPDGRPAIVQRRMGPMPCTGPQQAPFAGLTGSYDAESNRLYVGGTAATESWRGQTTFLATFETFLGGTFQEDRGQALLVRQLEVGAGELVSHLNNPTTPADERFGEGAAPLVLEWEIDLRFAGCGRRDHVKTTIFEGFVGRLGNDILAYCWDGRPYRGLQQGQQGYLVRIPLVPDPARPGVMVPQARSGGPAQADAVTKQVNEYVARRTPTLPGDVTVIFDNSSGRLMLVTSGATNGNAVWVFDPKADRFVGVITGGYADQPKGNTAVGFDSIRGRVYMLTQLGLLIAPIRQDPLPAGLLYPVLVNTAGDEGFVGSDRIAVAPALRRLFVDRKDHFAVLEDHVPDPAVARPLDPDSLTTDVAEVAGATVASASGQALSSGVNVVNAGGVPRLAGQNDPTCIYSPPNLEGTDDNKPTQTPVPDWEVARQLFGSCLPDTLAAAGHREAAVAASEVEAATSSGSVGRGVAFTFGSTDSGTDGDIRRFSDCGASTPDQPHRWARRWPLPDDASLSGDYGGNSFNSVLARKPRNPQADKEPHEQSLNNGRDQFWNSWADQREGGQEQYRAGCNEFQDEMATRDGPDLRAGTRGADGRGFPVPAAVCGDFGGTPTASTWPEQSAGAPQAGYPTSSASCDAGGPAAQGQASVGALALPNAAAPELSVARAWSKVSTSKTADGQVTVAVAVAEGVTVGPLSIGQVRSLAITKAHGDKGTARADLVRQWCGIRVAEQFEDGCLDADTQQVRDWLEEINAGVLQKVQLSVPEGSTSATPGGYQAVVTKHPAQRGGDQAVNDDDSHTVAALQAVLYNDGPKGRSRLVVQLAGVHAESRYGIIELPVPFGGFDPLPPETEPSLADPAHLPEEPGLGPEPAPIAPVPDSFTPDSFIEEEFGPDEVVRTNFSPPRPRVVTGPGGRGPDRIVRVPVQVVSDAINLLVQNPREAALLFVMFALLAAPAYLGLRRRSFARALAGT